MVRLLKDWFESDFQSLSAALDAADGSLHIRGPVRIPPMRAFTIVGEFLHDLRSALDHLAWQLVLINGGSPTRATVFPLGVDPSSHESVAGGVSSRAQSLIRAAQTCHQVGEDRRLHPLAMLRHLSNVDKHRQVPLQAVRLRNIATMGDGQSFSGECRLSEVAEDFATLKFVSTDASIDMEGTMVVAVHLERYEGDRNGIPAVTCLRELHGFVSGLIDSFEGCFGAMHPGDMEMDPRQ